MRSFILLLCLIPTIICAQNFSLEDQLKQAIKGKKAEIGIAVIIDGKDTVTVNNDIHYPLMSVFKFHQALALADYMGKQQQSLNFELTIKKEDLKPDTYSPLRDSFPQGGFNIDIADLLKYTLQQSDNNACDILFQYQGGVDAVNQYIHSLGVTDCAIVCTENEMHQDESLCYQNWTTPLAAARLLEIFRKEALFPQEYKDFIYQTMTERKKTENDNLDCVKSKEVLTGCGCTYSCTKEDCDNIHKLVLSCFAESFNNARLLKEVTEHKHTNERSCVGKEDCDDNNNNYREHNLLKL